LTFHEPNSEITIGGSVLGQAAAHDGGNIIIRRNIVFTGQANTGALTSHSGTVFVNGKYDPRLLIQVDKLTMDVHGFSKTTCKFGYRDYSYGNTHVWIKNNKDLIATKKQFGYRLHRKTYNGKKHSVALKANFGIGQTSVYYKGISGKRTKIPPKKIGEYKVSVNAVTGTYYGSINNLYLGGFYIVPKKSKIYKISVKKRQMRIKWRKLSDKQRITKYQIRYRKNGTKKWKWQSFSGKKSFGIIKTLSKGKRYQVCIRSYKTVKKKRFYSRWSKIKLSPVIN
jgi:hypothetical protein